MFNFIVEVDEMVDHEMVDHEMGEPWPYSLADNTTANLHPNLPNYALPYPNETHNRNKGKLKYINEYATN